MKIAPNVEFLSRTDWGARTDLPRLGTVLPSSTATEAIQHHTVIIDDDATPNRWESQAEVIPKMQRLQTIRPGLGLDVPYSWVVFLMEYKRGRLGLILCEGRGPYRRGAHTKWHNVTGRAMAIEGNTEIGLPITPYTEMLSQAWGWIKDEYALVNLGNTRPDRGGIVFGHRDFRREADRTTWTACPGQGAYDVLPKLTFDRWEITPPTPEPEEDEMKLEIVIKDYPVGRFYYLTTAPMHTKQHITNMAYLDYMQQNQDWPTEMRLLKGNEAAVFEGIRDLGPVPQPLD